MAQPASTTPSRLRPLPEQGQSSQLLVVAPTRRELGGLHIGLQKGVAVATTGPGEPAALSLASLLAECNPSLVLSLGFAGGLAPGLSTGALVLCDSLVASYGPLARHSERSESPSHRDGTRPLSRQVGIRVTTPSPPQMEADRHLLDAVVNALSEAGIAAGRGALLTVPSPLLTVAAKQRAGQETGAAMVDMEGYWLAQAARQHQVPFLAVRVVLDSMEQRLQALVAAIVADQGRHEWRHAARAVLTNPLAIGQLASLAFRSRQAQKALRQAAQVLLPALAAYAAAARHGPDANLRDAKEGGGRP